MRADIAYTFLERMIARELWAAIEPSLYYFVLFEFVDLAKAEDINVQIFEVDPKGLGFALCMIDYFFMIRPKSSSKAPFNLWPASPKFFMMKPKMIYHAVKTKLTILQEQRVGQSWKDEDLADDFARAVFRDRLQSVPNWLKEYAPTL